MEDQTRFDLNRALLAWKAELACQPGVSAENVQELETHLLESIAAFQRSGLNDEEAYAKARQELGSAAKVGAEFARANLLRIWRDRVFWIAFAGFIIEAYISATWLPVTRGVHWIRDSLGTPSAMVFSLLGAVPVLLFAASMATGHMELVFRRFSWLLSHRWRLAVVGVLFTIAANFLSFRTTGHLFIYEIGFLGFAILIMPQEITALAAQRTEQLGDWRNSIGVWRDRLFWIVTTQLAIAAWSMLTAVGVNIYLRQLPEPQQSAPPLLAAIIYFSVWLIPMGVVGLGLATGRLSAIARVLQPRWRFVLIATVLMMVYPGSALGILQWGFRPASLSPADWNFQVLQTILITFVAQAGFVVLVLGAMPSQQKRTAS